MNMFADEDWDVLVVGAGPAGSRAAEAASKRGASVLLIEKRKEIGVPVRCAEFLHNKVVQDLGVPSKAISQEIKGIRTFICEKDEGFQRSPGFIMNRDIFDKLLASRAEEAGVEVRTGMEAIGPLEKGHGTATMIVLGPDDKKMNILAKVIIGADGPTSKVGQWVDQRNVNLLMSHQKTVKLKEPLSETEVYLHPDYIHGYAWLFPKGDLANVGVGVSLYKGKSPKEILSAFIEKIGDRIGEVEKSTAGMIPVGGPIECVQGNVLLVGDAAGHTHPITGGGIHQAVECGRLAGEAAALFIEGDAQAFEEYGRAWKSTFGASLDLARRRRHEMEREWSSDVDKFRHMMHRCWIGFKEYYKD